MWYAGTGCTTTVTADRGGGRSVAWQSGRCVIATECSCVVPSQFVSEQDANLVEVSSVHSLELG